MKIAVIGAGYVGLVSGACFAEYGHLVTCLDVDIEKVTCLSKGECPIYEPGLGELVARNVQKKRLTFVTDWAVAVLSADVVFIAVGTPTSRRGNGYADLSYVYEAARSVAQYVASHAIVVNKSTVPVGTAQHVARILHDTNALATVDVASNPEFLREGAAIHDFMHPDRIVIGADTPRAVEVLKNVYRPLYLHEPPFVVTSPLSAELIKYASNAFLATKISFINEIANLCEIVGADVRDVAKGMGFDGRIGPKFLHAGPGFGGSCFPKDTTALLRIAQENGAAARIVEAVVEVNNAQKARMVRKIREAVGGEGKGQVLAVLGLTFKPETDDMRDAAALTILPALMEKGMRIRAHDPVGMEEARRLMPEIEYCTDPYMACTEADAVCLMTEWNPYRALDLPQLKRLLRRPIFIDLRNVYQPEVMRQAGFCYVSVGRRTVNGTA